MGLTLGMLDTKEGAAMRNTVEKRKIRQANTKASRKRAVLMSLGATNGLASSMVFTPVQGLELVNPDANGERVLRPHWTLPRRSTARFHGWIGRTHKDTRMQTGDQWTRQQHGLTPVQGLELVNPDANGERVRHRRIPSGFPRMLDFNLLFQKVVTQSFFICFFSLFYLSATLSLGALKISPLVVAASAWHLTSTSQ
eukprot:CAMPEP_0201903076 /NCGR_PEP_ID=MMETSP0902-20130614/55288_1 /ASSEMBLY_ACC=CAM_ASM_000551 /TAXON_ID=420261 /ORGANISM="Thalassiosira antarctica, Strain CCMP982" /LENGTH=196 /DNA_ID=CAMNT_0048437109 /DNA_START=616 /DNA_END=1206 /DNA_ORIENTATION=-